MYESIKLTDYGWVAAIVIFIGLFVSVFDNKMSEYSTHKFQGGILDSLVKIDSLSGRITTKIDSVDSATKHIIIASDNLTKLENKLSSDIAAIATIEILKKELKNVKNENQKIIATTKDSIIDNLNKKTFPLLTSDLFKSEVAGINTATNTGITNLKSATEIQISKIPTKEDINILDENLSKSVNALDAKFAKHIIFDSVISAKIKNLSEQHQLSKEEVKDLMLELFKDKIVIKDTAK